eukprot:2280450-Rhodomonas_salina.3
MARHRCCHRATSIVCSGHVNTPSPHPRSHPSSSSSSSSDASSASTSSSLSSSSSTSIIPLSLRLFMTHVTCSLLPAPFLLLLHHDHHHPPAPPLEQLSASNLGLRGGGSWGAGLDLAVHSIIARELDLRGRSVVVDVV